MTNVRTVLIYSLFLAILILFIILLNMIIVLIGDDIKNLNYASNLEDYINQNNLSLPFPNTKDYIKSGIYYSSSDAQNKILDRELYNFHALLKQNFLYEVDSYDCKYWAYVWAMYWAENKDRYNWNMKFIDTKNHVFVLVYNESMYCTLDLDEVNCLYATK